VDKLARDAEGWFEKKRLQVDCDVWLTGHDSCTVFDGWELWSTGHFAELEESDWDIVVNANNMNYFHVYGNRKQNK
jgi:hypothetical protein